MIVSIVCYVHSICQEPPRKLAMQEMRFGSLRKSVWLSIERLQLSALAHALRFMERASSLGMCQ